MKQLCFKSAVAWRAWLQDNHDKTTEVWLIFFKKETGKASIDYEAAVEKALCFGWIDSIIKKIDDERYARKFTPRQEDSSWSDLNKKRVGKLIKTGRMAASGLAQIEIAKANGQWDKPVRPNIEFDMPPELAAALAQNRKARENFEELAPSYRKQYIGWIAVAKRPETKARRIEEAIELLEKGQKLGLR